ncbi:hypothetical protein AC578_7505 [Pseudocercospora eumusae]|uniref:F-box domain-containing protein n=1 Tax=Pseudocercospora eumusae TaxID=321146 RepID=A0A139GV94_9PEZI|nr:hypothetical protein AC578_7505 [Pseudocercospora eumusae]
MDQSPLLRLPPELRNLVYEYALTKSDSPVDLREQQAGLTMTSRKIRQESLLIFYNLNTFGLEVPNNTSQTLANSLRSSIFGTRVGAARVRSMQKLIVTYHLSSLENRPVVPGCKNEGGWVQLCETLAAMGFLKCQVEWETESTSFLDSSFGGNYLAYLAETARLRIFDQILKRDWEEVSDSVEGAKASGWKVCSLD